MAIETNIGGDNNDLFVGEDKRFAHLVLDKLNAGQDPDAPLSERTSPDISSWAILFVVRTKDKAADPAIFSKSASVSGTYDADASLNEQRAYVTLTDDELNTVADKAYRYSWKRMDADDETILGFGNFTPKAATAR